MNILYLGVGIFIGSIFSVLFLSLCVASKMAERKMSVSKNFHLTEYQQQGDVHGKISRT